MFPVGGSRSASWGTVSAYALAVLSYANRTTQLAPLIWSVAVMLGVTDAAGRHRRMRCASSLPAI